jgi:hypothetical protein
VRVALVTYVDAGAAVAVFIVGARGDRAVGVEDQ